MSEQEKEIKASKLGSFLRSRREKMELALEDVAKQSPVTAGTIGDIETGTIKEPSLPVLRAFAKVYDVSLKRLVGMLGANAMPSERVARNKGGDFMSEQEKETLTLSNDDSLGITTSPPSGQLNIKMGMHGRPDFRRPDFDKDDDEMREAGPATMGATSFAQVIEAERAQEAAREVRKLANQVPELVEGIFQDPNIEDKDAAIADLGPEFSALVMEGMAAKERWQPLTDAVVKALSPLFGKKKEDPPDQTPASNPPETKNSFTVYKEADGGYRWLAIYSNKFRDRDNPPEIISEASHLRFAKMVSSGQLPFPELRLAHVPGSRWGAADFAGYDDKGFAVATGTIDKGKEWVADALMNNGEDMLTSHGMLPSSIKRDPQDPTVYVEHTTTEISPLLASKAANEFTGFSILDEVKEMAFSDDERAKLTALGVDPDRLEAEAGSKAKETEGLEFKEADKSKAVPETGDFVGRDEVKELVKSVAESTNQLVTVVGDLAKRIKTLEANKLTIDKETLERTPAASLSDLYKSTVGAEEAKIDGRTSLAKSGPEEAKAEAQINSSLPGVAGVIAERNQEIERGGVQ